MIGRIFRAHGVFCASHTWEVILAFLTLTACMYNVDITSLFSGAAASSSSSSSTTSSSARSTSPVPARQRQCQGWRHTCDGTEPEYNAADVILMTIVRCSAVLYSYYQFLNLHKFGSKYILGKCAFYFLVCVCVGMGTECVEKALNPSRALQTGQYWFSVLSNKPAQMKRSVALCQFLRISTIAYLRRMFIFTCIRSRNVRRHGRNRKYILCV